MKELAVIIIIAHKDKLSEAEKNSLRQCYKILGNYRIVLICPEGLNVSVYKNVNPDVEIQFIDPKWQSNYRMFNRLKIESLLYKKYEAYKFMLFYELDAWVFRDELEYWCNAGYDYIAAPWIEKMENGVPQFYPEGGNGGLSLRNIQSHLRVLKTWTVMKNPKEVWAYHKTFHNPLNMFLRIPVILLRMLGFQNNSIYVTKNCVENEDRYWSKIANKIDRNFKPAPALTEIKFSFEEYPSVLFKMNKEQLPFGCHAYEKHEYHFWKPIIASV